MCSDRNKKNSKVIFAKVFLLTALTTLIFPAHALVLKIATVSPDGTMWMKKMREGGAEISERTSQRVSLKFYPGGVMGNNQSVLRKMRIGQLQGGTFTAGNLAKVYPDIQIYSLPLLFKSQQEVDYVRSKMDAELLAGLEKKGYISFGFAGSGFAYTLSTAPKQSMEDLRQHKLWIPAGDIIGSTLLQVAGISPIPLPLSDVLTGLQTGLIDTVAISPVGAIAFQWYTKATYFMNPPLNYTYVLLAIDKKAFNKIRLTDQAIIRQVMTRINREIDQQSRLDNEQAKQALAKQGVSFIDFPQSMQTKWQEIADKTIAQLDNRGIFTANLLAALKGHLQQFKSATH